MQCASSRGTAMRSIVASFETENRRYKSLGEAAMAQLSEAQLSEPGPGGGNSIAVIVRHLSGNLLSRFTDFLTTDGEKPWRHREEEFSGRAPTREQLLHDWESGWQALLTALSELTDAHLHRTVAIRGETVPVHGALHRSLAHVGYHVGQIVYLAKGMRGADWKYLSVPPAAAGASSGGRASVKVVRIWHGRVPRAKAARYRAFLNARAVPDYRAVPGNIGAYVLEREEGDVTHFLTMTLWHDMDAIRGFAGDDVAVAKYYPEDEEFLLEYEPTVNHYEVAGEDG